MIDALKGQTPDTAPSYPLFSESYAEFMIRARKYNRSVQEQGEWDNWYANVRHEHCGMKMIIHKCTYGEASQMVAKLEKKRGL